MLSLTRILNCALLSAALALPLTSHADVRKPESNSQTFQALAPGSSVQLLKVGGPGKFIHGKLKVTGAGVRAKLRLMIDNVQVYDADVFATAAPRNDNDPVRQLGYNNGNVISLTDIVPPEALLFDNQAELYLDIDPASASPQIVTATSVTGAQ